MNLSRLWRRLWERAPRQLRFTREGKVLIGIALATGFAALNTGNNLLYLGWGMVLSAIVLSGVLSEATLRVLSAQAVAPHECRAGVPAAIPVRLLNNSGRVPAYAVEMAAQVRSRDRTLQAAAPFLLRVPPGSDNALYARFTPAQRGRHQVGAVVVATSYPFGFFEKSRRLQEDDGCVFWCFPRRVPVENMAAEVTARLGEATVPRPGLGEDFFSLRPYRPGDDVRHVHWRRSARTGKWVVVETESASGREVILELALAAADGATFYSNEYAIAVAGSLAESLLAKDYRVGLRGPGTQVPPEAGSAGRRALLGALARLEPTAPLPGPIVVPRVARIGVVAAGARAPAQLDSVIHLGTAFADGHGVGGNPT